MAFDGVNAALILSKGVGCPPNDMQSFSATSQEDGIKITFTGPKNSYVFGAANNDTLLSTPAGVMIRYSDTDYPADINDGTLLGVYNEDYNPVNPTEVTDNLIGLVFEQTYYFSAFPFSVDGIYNKSQAPANRASCQWVGNKGTINVTVATYDGYTGSEIGEYTITLVDQASSDPQNIQRTASGTGLTQIGNLEAGKTYIVTLTDTNNLTSDPSEPITIEAGKSYDVTMTYREKYGSISVTVNTASDFATLGEYKITLLDQAADSPQNVEKDATGKGTTVFENLVSGKQYKVRLGATANFIPPADSDVITVVGGETESVTMTYAAGMGSVVINVSTNPTGMSIGSYTISLVPQGGGSTLQQSGSGAQAVTFNNVPIGTYNVKGSSINHYTFNANGSLSVTVGQQSSHNVNYGYSASLQQATWEEIQKITQLGLASNVWSIGDTKTVTVNKITQDSPSSSTTRQNVSMKIILVHFDYNKTTTPNLVFMTKGFPLEIYDNNGGDNNYPAEPRSFANTNTFTLITDATDASKFIVETNLYRKTVSTYTSYYPSGNLDRFNMQAYISTLFVPTPKNVGLQDDVYEQDTQFSYFSNDNTRIIDSTEWCTGTTSNYVPSVAYTHNYMRGVGSDGHSLAIGINGYNKNKFPLAFVIG